MRSFIKAAAIAVSMLAIVNNSTAQTRSRNVPVNGVINSVPADILQTQAEARLISQNFYSAPAGVNITGNFGVTARWNTMGSLTAGTQILNGYRTQTNGRALVSGHSIAVAGPLNNVSNPFIQWIGNQVAGVTPGTLEFKFAVNPGGVGSPAPDVTLFNMVPNSLGTGGNSYATNGLVGQLGAGTFGNVFGTTDRWFGAGLFNLTGGTTVMGSRNQLDGTFLTHNIARSSTGSKEAIIGFGGNMAASPQADIQFLKIKYYDNPSLDPITGGDEIVRIDRKFKTVTIGYNNLGGLFIDPARLAVFDGSNPVPSALVAGASSGGLTDGIAVYGLSSGFDNFGNQIRYSAAVVGDVANSAAAGSPIDPNYPTNTYGILGIADNSYPGNPSATRFAGLFVGDVGITGNLYGPSDRKLKQNIEQETNILEKIMKLNPVHYQYKNQEFKNLALSPAMQHGFISQELEQVFPEMVRQINTPDFAGAKSGKEGESFKGINYTQLIPVLTKAIQELNTKVTELENKLAAAQAGTPASKVAANPFATGTYSLSQNVPNPFSKSTTVTYTVPENTRQALLAIFDLNGKMMQQYNLQQGKDRQQVIAANTLKPGMYIYTLLADGVELVSKKMIITE